jgi:hypothetical protein
LDQAYRELARKVSIRGFRKGKIPRPVLERYHRSSVEDEVMQKLIPSSFQQAVKDQGLRAVGQPKLDDITLNEEKALRYTATVEVLPDIALDTVGGWELSKEVRVVTDADVERELQDLQNRHVSLVSITEDRPVQEGDYVLISFEGFRDGQPVQGTKTENYALVVGSKSVIESVEQGLVGITALVVIACIFLHYESLSFLTVILKRMHTRARPRILLLIFAILFTHVLEIWIFGFAYYLLISTEGHGALIAQHPLGLLDCVYYSAVCFTTLGLGDVVPAGPVRFLTGTEALTGFVLITWSASFTFIEMQRFWKN